MSAGKNSWFYRRLIIFFVTGLASFLLVYLAMRGVQDGALHLMIAEGAWWVIFGIIATYVCGASIDDLISLRMGVSRNRRVEDQDAPADRRETR